MDDSYFDSPEYILTETLKLYPSSHFIIIFTDYLLHSMATDEEIIDFLSFINSTHKTRVSKRNLHSDL